MSKLTLSDGEWKIMKKLWQREPQTLKALTEELEPETGWNKSTVFMMLRRLAVKEAVRLDDSTKPQLWYASVTRAELEPEETESFLERVFNGSVGMLVSSLVSRGGVSRDELDELRKILDDAERRLPK